MEVIEDVKYNRFTTISEPVEVEKLVFSDGINGTSVHFELMYE